MRYKQAIKLSTSDFKRLYGVSPKTFHKMKEIVLKAKVGKRGCHSKLSIPDQILLTLQYWREYRTGIPQEVCWINWNESQNYF